MQTTAMGESLYLALFLWAVVYFTEFVRGDAKALTKCGLCLAGGLPHALRRMVPRSCHRACGGLRSASCRGPRFSNIRTPHRAAVVKFILIAASAPLLWLAYNGIVYRNPLEFANGPYSAKAIERRTQNAGNVLDIPAVAILLLAGMYFLKSAEVNVAENELSAAYLDSARWLAGVCLRRSLAVRTVNPSARPLPIALPPLLFLLDPDPFLRAVGGLWRRSDLRSAHGGRFTHYNVRYGLQLLPAFAVALAILVSCGHAVRDVESELRAAVRARRVHIVRRCSYAQSGERLRFRSNEAQVNMRTRHQLETRLASGCESCLRIPLCSCISGITSALCNRRGFH